jgi:hypothetical protein
MPEYRVYTVGLDGHYTGSHELECADDAEAMERAQQLVDGRDVELWQRARKVATATPAYADDTGVGSHLMEFEHGNTDCDGPHWRYAAWF